MIVTEQMAQRFAKVASDKLGCAVTFHHWNEHKTGAAIPVFSVPDHAKAQATELGLQVA